MLEKAAILSLQILTLYVLFQQGMLLGWFRIWAANWFDKWFGPVISRYVQKPLWDCFTCMSGLWTIELTQDIDLKLIFVVCAMNFIIEKSLNLEDEKCIGG